TLVLKPEMDEKVRKGLLDDMKKNITIKKEDLWGERALAYPIKRQTKGFYAHFEIEADPKDIKGLDKSLKLEEDVLRFLLIRR
ncbi:MAG: 30S ribosomal protein S6, partial [Patescibacteria group bacterium]